MGFTQITAPEADVARVFEAQVEDRYAQVIEDLLGLAGKRWAWQVIDAQGYLLAGGRAHSRDLAEWAAMNAARR